MLEVVGAGFGRTGTLSLKLALERLGFGPCHHMVEVIGNPEQIALWEQVVEGNTDWDTVFSGYRATVDWPGVHFWRELTAHYSDAKVILTVRDPERWYESVKETIFRVAETSTPDATDAGRRHILGRVVWDGDFDGRFEDKDHTIAVFNDHNEAVRREIPAGRLLEFEVGQGWEPLCAFLGVPVPDEPFPRSNDRQEFAARVAEHTREA